METNVCQPQETGTWRNFTQTEGSPAAPGAFAKKPWKTFKKKPLNSSPLVGTQPPEASSPPSTATPSSSSRGSEGKEMKAPPYPLTPEVKPQLEPDVSATKKKRKKRKKKGALPVKPFLRTQGTVHIFETSSGPVLGKVTVFKVESPLPLIKDENIPKPHYIPMKYWNQRYSIFSRYDEGILLDEESWFSATHEAISKCIAEQCTWAPRVMDGFAGAGGNVLQFARFSEVVAVELDSLKLQYLRNNAKVYGVCDKIKFVCGDFLRIAERQGPVDILFMSPPWGGPDYVKSQKYDIYTMMNPDIRDILSVCRQITRNIILYMPRNADPEQMAGLFTYLPGFERKMEMQVYYFGDKIKTVACFYGDFVQMGSKEVAEAMLRRFPKSNILKDIAVGCDLDSKLAQYMVSSEIELHGADALLASLHAEATSTPAPCT